MSDKYMIKIIDILKENYGQNGKFQLPSTHQAGMKVPKGGSCCANCKFFVDNKCQNKYYQRWSQTNDIPVSADEYCSDWWEPTNKNL